MRVLVVHNRYQHKGGEDSVFAAETAMLEQAGHAVRTLEFSNDAIHGFSAKARTVVRGVRNPDSERVLDAAIADFRPDVMHVHNFFPTASPAVFWASARARVATVWSLHNYRLTCVNGFLLRNGGPCEDCVGRSGLSGILHRCYRGSLIGSAVATAVHRHWVGGDWLEEVDRFIALNPFARRKFVEAGLAEDRLAVKPNFIPDPGAPTAPDARAGALFVGRLSFEKGVDTLIDAWQHIPHPLTVVGSGPEEARLRATAPANVTFLGAQPPEAVQREMARAKLLVVPSRWYENFPMTVVEAFAAGTPVVASRLGALAEIVTDGVDGYHFAPADPQDLAAVVNAAFADPARLEAASLGARATYERELTEARNLEMLERIYTDAITHRRQRGPAKG